MGEVISTIGGVVLAIGVFFAVFYVLNKILYLANTSWWLFLSTAGLLIGLLVGALINGSPIGGGLASVFIGGGVGALLGAGLAFLRTSDTQTRQSIAEKVRPWVFVGPALVAVSVTLIIPSIRTGVLSFKNRDSSEWIGFDNFEWIFTNDDIFNLSGWRDIFSSRLFIIGVVGLAVGLFLAVRSGRVIGTRFNYDEPAPVGWTSLGVIFILTAVFAALRGVIWNNLWWVFAVTVFATGIGLFVAAATDRMNRGETIVKAIIFLPMAISMVGASVIWRFMYIFQPVGEVQIGALNAVRELVGFDPIAFLIRLPWNTLFLIAVMIWIQTGFAMVVLSAAIKAVPTEQLEAARVDGATDGDIFWRVTVPNIRSTIAVVVTTLIVVVMKVYDIVKVMTNGEFETNVIANEMFDQAFRFTQSGRGAALASVLLMFVAPIMYVNVRRVQKEAALR